MILGLIRFLILRGGVQIQQSASLVGGFVGWMEGDSVRWCNSGIFQWWSGVALQGQRCMLLDFMCECTVASGERK